ncbi:MAG: CoA pyrophosphatase [Flavobacteriaceae bacterium]|jgi:8-oxo-dGTP pyrophosphatase MutT (NUDIX family)|nr:CoA pyrophosphatase [Flavobacteriaceae bacterium]
MDFEQLKNILVSKKLPGWNVQKELSPPYRGEFTLEKIRANNPIESSVLIVLYKKNGRFFFPVILRSVYEGIHSGQIGLPGGKKESFDLSCKDTALRETHEELGLEESKLEIVKNLTPLYIPPSNFYVQPYIAFYKESDFVFDTDKTEVQKVFEIELHKFLFETEVMQKPHPAIVNKSEVPAFQYNDIMIWGATAMMLNEFKFLLKN